MAKGVNDFRPKKRGMRDFSRRMIKVIAEDYANSSVYHAGTHFCEKYNITSSVFYEVLKKAIRESIVSERVGKRIAEKAAQNSGHHGGKGGSILTMRAYERCFEERKEFEFSKTDVKKYALEFVNSGSLIGEFCAQHVFDHEMLWKIFMRAIEEDIVSDIELERLRYRLKKVYVAYEHNGEPFEEYFDRAVKKRERTREEERKKIRMRRQQEREERAKKLEALASKQAQTMVAQNATAQFRPEDSKDEGSEATQMEIFKEPEAVQLTFEDFLK